MGFLKCSLRPFYRPFTVPMPSLIKEILGKNFVRELDGLEVFGRDGDALTKIYAPYTRRLQIWEVDPAWEPALRHDFSRATIKIVDSFQEIKQTNDKFNFIVIDSPLSTYGDYCEHFELFPAIYRIMQSRSIIILNVIPRMNRRDNKRYPYLFNADQLRRRAAFYCTERPEDISMEDIVGAYARISAANGYSIRDHHWKKRGLSSSFFLVLYLKKCQDGLRASSNEDARTRILLT